MKAIVRTLVIAAVTCGLILAVYWQLSYDAKQRHIAELEQLNQEMSLRLAEKEAMLDRLSRTRRLAHVEVMAQRFGPDGRPETTDLRFIEVDEQGRELARQEFVIPGGVMFIDGWTVKFSHEDVALGHPLRGRSLVLLRRLYSDRMAPRDGLPIDTPGAVPSGYAGSEIAAFEQAIWARFWEVAGDPAEAARLGIRVAQGEAVYAPVREGQRFELIADAVGGLNLIPLAAGTLEDTDTLTHAND